jgi:hypothetical protein
MLAVSVYYAIRRRRYPVALLFLVLVLQNAVGVGLIISGIWREHWLGTALAYLILVVLVALSLEILVSAVVLRIKQPAKDKARGATGRDQERTAAWPLSAEERAVMLRGKQEGPDGWRWTAFGRDIDAPPQWEAMLFSLYVFWGLLFFAWAPRRSHVVAVIVHFILKTWPTIQANIMVDVYVGLFVIGLVVAGVYNARKNRWGIAFACLCVLALGLYLLVAFRGWVLLRNWGININFNSDDYS